MKRLLLLALCGLTVAVPRHAGASPLFEAASGYGGLGALQARNAGPSAASAYFNPALLLEAPQGLTAGVLILRSEVGVHLDARSSLNDVQVGAESATHADFSTLDGKPLPTSWLDNGKPASANGLQPALAARPRQGAGTGHQALTYEVIGLVVKAFHDRVALGFYGMIPNSHFLQFASHFSDERDQYSTNSLHPTLYEDRMTALSLAASGALRLTPTLSLGFGTSFNVRANALAPVFVANASQLDNLTINLRATANVKLAPVIGLAWRPIKRLHFTATVHTPERMKVRADFSYLLTSGYEQKSGFEMTFAYQPWQVGAGASYDFVVDSRGTWSAIASLLYGRWSKFIDTMGARPRGAYEWNDTIGVAAGVRRTGSSLNLAVDANYAPTPVPKQTGRTNYVDNDRVGLSVALECPFSLFDWPVALGLQAQGARMISRHQSKITPLVSPSGANTTPKLVKDEVPDDAIVGGKPVAGRDGLQTNNPGYPGFSSSGWVASVGLYARVKF